MLPMLLGAGHLEVIVWPVGSPDPATGYQVGPWRRVGWRVPPRRPPRAATVQVELSCLPGLAKVALAEVRGRLGAGSALRDHPPRLLGAHGREDAVSLRVPAPSLSALHSLRTVVAVQRVHRFEVPRPKALLGDAVFRSLVAELRAAVAQQAQDGVAFSGLRLEAAGRDSEVMQRLARSLAEAVKLPLDPDEGDLLLRLRPDDGGWLVLVRTTRRPLSARPYRVCDRPGGLNASAAAAILWLARPAGGVRAVNLFAGSGTMAIELALADPKASVVGLDIDAEAVDCARRNATAARLGDRLRFETGDATATGLPDASTPLILADPPWGDAVGSHASNRKLHPAFLTEAARLLQDGGRLAWVTHELRLLQKMLEQEGGPWKVLADQRVWHGGHHPHLVVLERRRRTPR